jgi:hypothetical protein
LLLSHPYSTLLLLLYFPVPTQHPPAPNLPSAILYQRAFGVSLFLLFCDQATATTNRTRIRKTPTVIYTSDGIARKVAAIERGKGTTRLTQPLLRGSCNYGFVRHTCMHVPSFPHLHSCSRLHRLIPTSRPVSDFNFHFLFFEFDFILLYYAFTFPLRPES